MPIRPAARRNRTSFRLGAFVALVPLIVLAACGSDDDRSEDEAEPAAGSGAAAEFPVTIEHEFGETVIEEEPQRVVSIGFTDHDALLALDVEPVAIRQWYGDYEFVWPWAEEALGTLEPEVLPSTDLNFEQIAALRPDLIIGQYIDLEKAEYEKLSQIAPTVAEPGDHPAFGAPWQLMTRNLGAAVGKAEEADALVADVEGQFEQLREEHPEFEGVELAYAGVYGTDAASYYVETDGSTRMAVLQDLGFVVPEELAALGEDAFYHDISAEQLSLLDQDVVLWEPAVLELLPEVEKNPIYRTLEVAKEDRDVFLTDPEVAGAMAHSSVLSLPVALDFLVPELTRAVANLEE
jgi:iron complex transport system substrate-binding protein